MENKHWRSFTKHRAFLRLFPRSFHACANDEPKQTDTFFRSVETGDESNSLIIELETYISIEVIVEQFTNIANIIK